MIRVVYSLLFLFCASFVVNGQDPVTLEKAQDGDIDAQYRLAMYCYKDGVTRDDDQYVYWLTKLANNPKTLSDEIEKLKVSLALCDLGILYKKGDRGLLKDMDKFEECMKDAFFIGNYAGAYYLGDYYNEIGDKQESIYWHKKAMDLYWEQYQKEFQHSFSALRKLGVTYHPADHVGRNHSVSVSGSSSASTSSQNQRNQVKEYIETVPIQVWQACGGCNGSGQCHICYGSGWTLSYSGGKSTCFVCHGTGKCTHCAGHGGKNVVQYEQRKVYR